MLPQLFCTDGGAVFFQRFIEDEFFPFFKAEGGRTGGTQPHPFQQGNRASANDPHNILRDQVLRQVEFKGTESVGGDCNPVLPFFTVSQGDAGLRLQFFLFQGGNILPQDQCFAGLSGFPFQTDNVEMFPLLTVLLAYFIFILDVCVAIQPICNGAAV